MRRLKTPRSGIYEIACLLTGDKYIGQSRYLYRREWDHFNDLRLGKHANAHLQQAYNKYGRPMFCFRELLLCAPELLDQYEQAFMDSVRPAYNILRESVTGPKGCKATPEAKAKMSAFQKGRKKGPMSEEQKRKISAAKKGVKQSIEHSRKKSEWMQGQIHYVKTYPGLIAPDGIEYPEITNLVGFCREHDLNHGSTWCVIMGRYSQHKGWRRYGSPA